MSPETARLVGAEATIELAVRVSTVAIRAGPEAAASFAAAAPAAARRTLDGCQFRRWAEIIASFAGLAPESLSVVLERTEELLQDLDPAALESWLLAGVRAGGGDPARRLRFFRRGAAEAERLLARSRGELCFGDVERRMRAWFIGLWGDLAGIGEATEQASRPRATFRGRFIIMPVTVPGFRGAALEGLFRASLAHIGAHLAFASPQLPRGTRKPLERAVISLIEDARVEHLAMKNLPGLALLWRQFHVARPAGFATTESLLARLARALIDPDYDDPHGWVAKGKALFFAEREHWYDPAISCAIGNLLANDLGQMRLQFDPKRFVVEPAYRDDNLGLWEEDPEDATTPVFVEMTGESFRSRHDDGGRERPGETTQGEGAGLAAETAEEQGVVVARLSEWDWQAGCDRPEWVTVREVKPSFGRVGLIAEAIDRHPAVAQRIDALVRAARISRGERLRRRADGERLDLDAAIAAISDLRSGRTPDAAVYELTTRRRRDLAVALILDASLSTADRAAEEDRTILDLERDAAALLGHAMAAMGDPFAIFAFDSRGRDQVRILSVKRFEEPFGPGAAGALAGISPGFSTRLGAALRFAGKELAGQKTHRKLALVVSDGEPFDIDSPDPRYLVEDARHAVFELHQQGIDAFCLGLGGRHVETLGRIFGRRGFAVVRRIGTLPERLAALYFRLAR